MTLTANAVGDGVLPPAVEGLLGGGAFTFEQRRELGLYQPDPLEKAWHCQCFVPSQESDSPQTLFEPKIPPDNNIPAPRWIRRSNPREFLVFTDGACTQNGGEDASAGCAFVFRPETSIEFVPRKTRSDHSTSGMLLHTLGSQKFRLENVGPTGHAAAQTSSRAELRAVLAVLSFRHWVGEGLNRLVIATDSSYVVDGCTDWVKRWQQNGWQTSTRKPVKNKDLWEEFIKQFGRQRDNGLEVQFWLIPRALNSVADRLAKQAARDPACAEWAKISGILC